MKCKCDLTTDLTSTVLTLLGLVLIFRRDTLHIKEKRRQFSFTCPEKLPGSANITNICLYLKHVNNVEQYDGGIRFCIKMFWEDATI